MKLRLRFFARQKKTWAVVVLVTVALKLSFAVPYRPVEPLPADILDMHCHVAGIGAGGSGCLVTPKLRDSWKFGIYLKAFGVTRMEIEKQGGPARARRCGWCRRVARHEPHRGLCAE